MECLNTMFLLPTVWGTSVKLISFEFHKIKIFFNFALQWTSDGGVEADGFYVYYRAVSSAGAYEKVVADANSRSLVLSHLASDTAYEVKIQAYNSQAASDFSTRLVSSSYKK